MWVPAGLCRKLYDFDNALRFGVAYLPGQGMSIAVLRLISPGDVFDADPRKRRSMSFTWDQVKDRLRIQGPDGKEARLHDRIPVLECWPSQSWGLRGVLSGDYLDALRYRLKPSQVYDHEYRESIRQKGRAIDDAVRQDSEETSDYHRFLGRDGANSDKPMTREDIRTAIRSGVADDFLRVRDGDTSDSFENQALQNAGLAH